MSRTKVRNILILRLFIVYILRCRCSDVHEGEVTDESLYGSSTKHRRVNVGGEPNQVFTREVYRNSRGSFSKKAY